MRLSIAIAGSGIGGLAAAGLLARQGHNVVAFDRMAAPQPIGSGLILQPVGLAALDEIGAGDVRELGAPVKRLFGRVVPSQRVVLDVRYEALGRDRPCGLGVHRGALFQALLKAAKSAGVAIEHGREVVSAAEGRIRFSDGRDSARFDLVVDALGVRSPLARMQPIPSLPFGALWANLDWAGPFDSAALEQRYEKARMMVGVLPIGRLGPDKPRLACLFWSLKHSDHAAWRAAGLAAWKAEVMRLWPETEGLLAQVHDQEQLIFATYSHGSLRHPVGDRLARIGDCWHSASPQLGQGANMALLDAVALARAVACSGSLDVRLREYARVRKTQIAIYQLASWLFTPAYQSDSDLLAFVRDWIAAPLSRVWPAPQALAALVAGQIGSPLRRIAGLGVDE